MAALGPMDNPPPSPHLGTFTLPMPVKFIFPYKTAQSYIPGIRR